MATKQNVYKDQAEVAQWLVFKEPGNHGMLTAVKLPRCGGLP